MSQLQAIKRMFVISMSWPKGKKVGENFLVPTGSFPGGRNSYRNVSLMAVGTGNIRGSYARI